MRALLLLPTLVVSFLTSVNGINLPVTAVSDKLKKIGVEVAAREGGEEMTGAGKHQANMNSKDCAKCHSKILFGGPGLGELREGWVRKEIGKLELPLLRKRCEDCHKPEIYLKPLLALTHSIRSIGEHLDCLSCHKMPTAEVARESWDGKDYRAEWCFECHKDVEHDFAFSSGHKIGRKGVLCVSCHQPHKENEVAILLEMLPQEWLASPDARLSNEACLNCHPWLGIVGNGSGFMLGTVNLHELHLEQARAACVECHNPHGGVREHQIRLLTILGEGYAYQDVDGGGNCTVRCHQSNHVMVQYRK